MSNLNCIFSFKLKGNISANKSTQQYDVPIKVLKKNNGFSHRYYATTSIILYLVKISVTV